MNFNLANNVPITITIDGKPYTLERWRRRDFSNWASVLDAQRLERATEGMEDEQRARWLTIYQAAPTTYQDMFARVTSPEGTDYVIRLAMEKAGADAVTIDKLLDEGGPKELASLALAIASLVEPDPPRNRANSNGDRAGGGEDPLSKRQPAASLP